MGCKKSKDTHVGVGVDVGMEKNVVPSVSPQPQVVVESSGIPTFEFGQGIENNPKISEKEDSLEVSVGDFNEILASHEIWGSLFNSQRSSLFCDVMDICRGVHGSSWFEFGAEFGAEVVGKSERNERITTKPRRPFLNQMRTHYMEPCVRIQP
ncbi:hypothetical protein PIB30_050143 [Stylosanthes scabra]|uniref:Uncharacterized protein n=1 Tax=Stylosanthes scabra TaxID=79078 RepID=A0ABU6WKW6_9FABA|nr:hypothetical protein [Stylosanthes scabra]